MKQQEVKSSRVTAPSGMADHVHTQNIVMVCVTRQRTCERLIAYGEKIAKEHDCLLHVVHAIKPNENFLGDPSEGEALEYLFTAASLYGGELTVIRTENVEQLISDYAIAHHAYAVVLGASPVRDEGMSFIEKLEHLMPNVRIEVV